MCDTEGFLQPLCESDCINIEEECGISLDDPEVSYKTVMSDNEILLFIVPLLIPFPVPTSSLLTISWTVITTITVRSC